MIFTIPSTTPPGKYLVRVEQLYLSYGFNRTQFYVNCAQVEVVGPGGGKFRLRPTCWFYCLDVYSPILPGQPGPL